MVVPIHWVNAAQISTMITTARNLQVKSWFFQLKLFPDRIPYETTIQISLFVVESFQVIYPVDQMLECLNLISDLRRLQKSIYQSTIHL